LQDTAGQFQLSSDYIIVPYLVEAFPRALGAFYWHSL
jgi:hypothetical protein